MRVATRAATLVLALGLLWTSLAGAGETATHHDIEAAFYPATGHLTLTDRITAPAPLSLRLADWLQVTGALADGVPVPFHQDGTRWHIKLPEGAAGIVSITAEGRVPPLRSSDHRQGGAVAGPDGGFLPGYGAWFPITDADSFSYRLAVSVPASQRAISSGRLAAEEIGTDVYRVVFEAERALEPPSLFTGPYEVREGVDNGIRIRTYFHPELAGEADHYLDASARFLADFSSRIGAYPYQDLHIVSAPLPTGLGFPGLIYIGRQIVPLPFMRGRSLAHEVLHSWWGSGVAIDYEGGNWAEGLTTYMADYELTAAEGPAAAREMRLGWLRDFAALPPDAATPVTRFIGKTDEVAQVIGYGKTAMIFHMLRQEIGEIGFDQGLRLFWEENRGRRADWAHIRSAFETTAGRDLGWFFDQWLERPGAPAVSLMTAGHRARDAGHGVEMDLAQADPAYRVRLPVDVETEAGLERKTLSLDTGFSRAEFQLGARPVEVAVDPDYDIFRRLLPGESAPILRDVTLSPDTRTVLLGTDPAFRSEAADLAARLLGREVPPDARSAVEPMPDGPALVIGNRQSLRAFIAAKSLPEPPPVTETGNSVAWVQARPSGGPILFVAAENAADLKHLKRALPHYGGRGFVAFADGRAIEKGVFEPAASPLRLRLDR